MLGRARDNWLHCKSAVRRLTFYGGAKEKESDKKLANLCRLSELVALEKCRFRRIRRFREKIIPVWLRPVWLLTQNFQMCSHLIIFHKTSENWCMLRIFHKLLSSVDKHQIDTHFAKVQAPLLLSRLINDTYIPWSVCVHQSFLSALINTSHDPAFTPIGCAINHFPERIWQYQSDFEFNLF